MLRNATGVGCQLSRKKRFEGSTLLTLRGCGWGHIPWGKKHYVTLEWPPRAYKMDFLI